MSFILEDKNLSSFLEKIGADFLKKYGQDTTKNIDQNTLLDTAKLLINQLGSEVSETTDEKFMIPSGTTAQPGMNDLNSLSHLVDFLAANKVMYGNQELAVFNGITKEPTVNKDGLKEYINKLRNDSIDSKNNLFILMVSKLIKEANEKYSFDIKPIDVATAQKESTTENMDNIQLDSLPKLIDFKNQGSWSQWSTEKPLLGKDINSKQSFATWIKTSPELQISDNGKVRDVLSTDICNVLNIMLERSKKPDPNDLSGEKDKYRKYYSSKIYALSSQYEGCKLEGTSSITSEKEVSSDKIEEEFSKIISIGRLPLQSNAINLTIIKEFLEDVKAFLPKFKDAEELKEIKSDIPNILRWIDDGLKALSKVSSTKTQFMWNFSNRGQNQQLLEEVFTTDIIRGIDNLMLIMRSLGDILHSLYSLNIDNSVKEKFRNQYNLSAQYLEDLRTLRLIELNKK